MIKPIALLSLLSIASISFCAEQAPNDLISFSDDEQIAMEQIVSYPHDALKAYRQQLQQEQDAAISGYFEETVQLHKQQHTKKEEKSSKDRTVLALKKTKEDVSSSDTGKDTPKSRCVRPKIGRVLFLSAIIALSAIGAGFDTATFDNSKTSVNRMAYPSNQETYHYGFECDRVTINCTQEDEERFEQMCQRYNARNATRGSQSARGGRAKRWQHPSDQIPEKYGNTTCTPNGKRTCVKTDRGGRVCQYPRGMGKRCEYIIRNRPTSCTQTCDIVANPRECTELALRDGAVDFQECTGEGGGRVTKDETALISGLLSGGARWITIFGAIGWLFFESTCLTN